MPDPTSTSLWYVVHTKSQKELLAAGMLEERLDLNVYLPEVLQRYRGVTQLRPFFPRYLFVEADLDSVELTAINSTPGVLQLVAFEEKPLPLTPGIVENIRAEVERINAEGGLLPGIYREGDVVRLREGPLQGLHAVFVRHLKPSDRVVVLLNFLGQENQVELDIAQIERAGNVPKRERRTRGKGRKIKKKENPGS